MSLLRKLQYEKLSQLKIDGKILDLGGDKRSGYHQLIKGNHQMSVVNINPEAGPDLDFDISGKFPLKNNSYDAVLGLNVLEHIFNYKNVVDEGYRVLKDDGIFFGAVPFLFNVHGSPDDYFRYTRSALEKIFKDAGFKEIEIKELGTGIFSIIFQLKYGFYRFAGLRNLAMQWHIFLDRFFVHGILKFLRPDNHLTEKHLPLGYFFIAKK